MQKIGSRISRRSRAASLVSFLAAVGLQIHSVAGAEPSLPVDQYGGLMTVNGTPGTMFHIEKIGNRWWIVTPEGHGMHVRAMSKVSSFNNMDWGGSGGFLSYDALYLQPQGGQLSPNLKSAGESTVAKDVVIPGAGYTLKNVGDAIYIGSERLRPNFTYFWLDQLGKGGRVEWQYSTAEGFKPINGSGNPFKGMALSNGGSFNLDCGDYIAPDANGNGKSGSKNANKITWWNLTQGFPADFAPSSLPADPTPRYWIKGVVVTAFETAPVLNQTFERAEMDDTVQRKYGPGQDYNKKWAAAITDRFKSWGLNAAGYYSYRYEQVAPQLSPRMPTETSWQLSGDAMKPAYGAKNIYAGAEYPPGSGKTGWAAKHADPFDAHYRKAVMEIAARLLKKANPWAWTLLPEEADWLYGFNHDDHNHLGYVVLAQNPYRAEDAVTKVKYEDKKFYAKYALRDFLRSKYASHDSLRSKPQENLPAITVDSAFPLYNYDAAPKGEELAALQRLNQAWGTRYTTWGTSSGNLLDGTNAWGKGTGFMDENGAGVVNPKVRFPYYKEDFTRADSPAIRKDLDEFVKFTASCYGSILKAACDQGPRPPLIFPIYRGIDPAFEGLGPYVDGFWATPKTDKEAAHMYNLGHKPIIVADYVACEADSPNYFNCKIKEIRFDAASGNTVLYCPDLKYNFRSLWFIRFPEADELNKTGKAGGKTLVSRPRISKAHWDTIEFKGDYTAALKPGMSVEFVGIYSAGSNPSAPSQEERAKTMIGALDSTLMAKGDDGMYFTMGWEHWCLYDDGVNNWGEVSGCGIATLHDNAYDGVEARRAVTKDARGYIVGGEEGDYGNLLGSLGAYLRSIDQKLLQAK